MTRKDIAVRSAILSGVATLSLLFLVTAYQRPVSHAGSGFSYPSVGVSLFWETDAVVVRVDDREERVPRADLANSSIYHEAIARIPRDTLPADTRIVWSRVLRYWLPLTMVTWWVLFRLWQPLRPYIEGQ